MQILRTHCYLLGVITNYDEQPVLSQNLINALECQSYNSRVLADILALQKPMEIPKTGNT